MALQTKTLSQECSNGTGYTLKLTLTEDSTNVSGNYSTISYKLELISTGYNYQQWGTGYTVTINGSVVASQERGYDHQTSISKNSSITLCSGTTTVAHNNDGSKTIAASGIGATLDIGGSPAPGPITISGSSWTLTTIPRKSTLSISNGTLGSSTSMTVTTNSSSFTHTLTYTCGSLTSAQSMGSSNTNFAGGGSKSYTFPVSLASQNTSGTSVSVTVKLETFNSGTSLGSNTYTVSMSIPSSVKPAVSAIGITDVKGHVTTYKAYVQNQSTINVAPTIDTSNCQGASVSTKIQIKKSSTVLYSSNSNISGYKLTESGTITILVTATDTRGRSASDSTTITVKAYSPPEITSFSAKRVNSSGTAVDNGTYAQVTFSAKGSPLTTSSTNYNTMTYKVYYKMRTSSSYSNITVTSQANKFSVSNVSSQVFGGGAIATDKSYLIYMQAIDAFNTTTSVTVTLKSQGVFFKADAANNALSIGKVETSANKFCVAWQTEFDNNIVINNNSTVSNIKLPADQWYASVGNWGLDANNSDIIKVNGLFFADAANEPYSEGIHFYRSASKNDTLYGYNGVLYWMPNHDKAADGTTYKVLTENNTKRYITTAVSGTNYAVNRWSDGIEEFWCSDTINVTGWNTWGSIYEGNAYRQFSFGSYPFKKYTYPMITANVYASFGLCGCELYLANSTRWQYSPRIYPLRPNNTEVGTVYVNLHAVGVYTSSENFIPPVKTGSYSGVTTTLQLFSGRTQVSGTATATGGHGTLMSDTVTLAAGTYNVEVVTTGTNSCKDAWIRSPNTNHAQLTIGAGGTYTAEFTLSAETTGVYASIRVESGVTYSGTVCFSLFKTA